MILVSYSLFVHFLRAISFCTIALLSIPTIGMELSSIIESEEENRDELWPPVREWQTNGGVALNAIMKSCVTLWKEGQNRRQTEQTTLTSLEMTERLQTERSYCKTNYNNKWHHPKKKPQHFNLLVEDELEKGDFIAAYSCLNQYAVSGGYDASSLYKKAYNLAMGKENFRKALDCASRCSKENEPDPKLYTLIFDKAFETKKLATIIHPTLQTDQLTHFVQYLRTLRYEEPIRLSVYKALANQKSLFFDGLLLKDKIYLLSRVKVSEGKFFDTGNLFKKRSGYDYSAFCTLTKELYALGGFSAPLVSLLTDRMDTDAQFMIEAVEKYKVLPSVEKFIKPMDADTEFLIDAVEEYNILPWTEEFITQKRDKIHHAALFGNLYCYISGECKGLNANKVNEAFLEKAHTFLSTIKPKDKGQFPAEAWKKIVEAQSSTLARLADKAKLSGDFLKMLDLHIENLTWGFCNNWGSTFKNFGTLIVNTPNKEEILLKIKKFVQQAELCCTEKNDDLLFRLGNIHLLGFHVQYFLKQGKAEETQKTLLISVVEKNREKATLYYNKIVESPFAEKKLKYKALLKLGRLAETDQVLERHDERLNKALECYEKVHTGVGLFHEAAVYTALRDYAKSQLLCNIIVDTEKTDKKLLSMVHALRATNGIQLESIPYTIATIAQDLKTMFKYAPWNRKATYWHYLSTQIGSFLELTSKSILKNEEKTAESADLLATYVLYETRRIKNEQIIQSSKLPLTLNDIIRLIRPASYAAGLGNSLGELLLAELLVHKEIQPYTSNQAEKKPTILPMRPVSFLYKASQSDDVWIKAMAQELLAQLANIGHLPSQAILIAEYQDNLAKLGSHPWWKEPVYQPLFDINLDKEAIVFLKKLLDKDCVSKLHTYVEENKKNPDLISLPLFLMHFHTQNAINIFNVPKGVTISCDRTEMDYINQSLLNIKPFYLMLLNNKKVPDVYKKILNEPTYKSMIAAADGISKSRKIESKDN